MITFTKKGNEFKFVAVQKDDYITYRYYCSGIERNKYSDDGFYTGAKLLKSQKSIKFGMHEIIVNGKKQKCNGVGLVDDIFEKFVKLEESIMKEKKIKEKEFVDKLVSGELKIEWYDTTYYFDGYDVPTKKFKIEIPENLNHNEILKKAVMIFGLSRNTDIKDYIEMSLKDEEKTGMMTLEKVLEKRIENKKLNDKKFAEIVDKAKNTGVKQELNRHLCECNDKNEDCSTDVVIEYVMPDGKIKTERIHTY